MNATPWDTDIDAGPVSTSSRPAANLVLPERRPEPPAALLVHTTSGDMDIWHPSPSIVETSTPVERAQALMIRQLLLWIIWLILAIAGGLAAWQFAAISGLAATLFGLAVFGGAAAASFIALDRAERSDSATGLEKHRINEAAALKRLELKQAHELRRLALDAYLDQLEERP